MRPKMSQSEGQQLELGRPLLESFIDMKHELVFLGKVMNWKSLCEKFGESFHESQGRPGLPTRLMVGLIYLKYLYNLSDEKTVKMFLQNPYWQYFCGFIYFQKEAPLEASSLTRFRDRLGEKGAEELLSQTIEMAGRCGLLKKEDLKEVIVDTTVQEKNISYPTDGNLIHKILEKLVDEAKREGIVLRQSYKFKSQKEKVQGARYFHARQYKRGKASVKRQRNWLGRVIRDIKRKKAFGRLGERMRHLLGIGQRIQEQERYSKNKIYSIHEPQVECVSKGKAHKPYEFGNKVSLTVTRKKNWIVGAKSFFGNPFDGKTLKDAISQTERLIREEVERICVDRGYRGKVHHPSGKDVFLSGLKTKDSGIKKFLRRRSSIEPVIGHLKEDHRLGLNYLGGVKGDEMNPIFAASAFNIQKLLRAFVVPFLYWLKRWSFFCLLAL